LPPALSTKGLTGGGTEIFNVYQIPTIVHHPVGSDDDPAAEIIFHTQNWLNWNGNLDNQNHSEADWATDIESDIDQDKCIKDSESPAQPNVNAAPNVPRFIRPTRKSKSQADKVLLTVNAMEMRKNQGIKKKLSRMHLSFTNFCV